MNVTVENKPKSLVSIKCSLEVAEFEPHIQSATKHFVEHAELPGFRKGKAPEKIVIEKIGDAKILEEAAERALNAVYPNILKEYKIRAITWPQIRIVKLARGNPFEWGADVPVAPEVTLPDYKDIAKAKNTEPKENLTVSEEEITQSLDQLRESRKIKKGKEENQSADVLPDLNDEFAKSLGNFATVEDLKKAIKENVKLEKERKAHEKRRMEILHGISEKTVIDTPDALIENEKEKMLHELKANIESMGIPMEKYLEHLKKSVDDLKAEWTKDAEERARFALVLREVGEKENLIPPEKDINEWADKYLSTQPEETRSKIDRNRVKEYAYGILRNEKVFKFLESC